MGFIETFFRKNPKDITKKDIEDFISRKIEENRNLDYKDIKKYNDPDGLSKNISAFANSDGGLLILGVSEQAQGKGKSLRMFPEEITWGDSTLSKETLEDKLNTRIQPRISGLKIVPIREDKCSARGIFLIDTPKSDNPPHMASDNKYYRRLNFEIQPMDHYEVANLFMTKWVMKEKLIEKIYEPLSSVLEKHAKELEEYYYASPHDVEDILSKTYYKMQMPDELLDKLDYYIENVNHLNKEGQLAAIAVRNILNRTVLRHFKDGSLENDIQIEFRRKSKRSTGTIPIQIIHRLLLKNKSFKIYVNQDVYEDVDRVDTIEIKYSDYTRYLSLDDFERFIWEKCLKTVNENTEITCMKKHTEALLENAWDLIDEIIKY